MNTQITPVDCLYGVDSLKGTGWIFHCHPSLGKIDVFINGLRIFKGLTYKLLSAPAAFPLGRCQIDLYKNGQLLTSAVMNILSEEKLFIAVTGVGKKIDIRKYNFDFSVPTGEAAARFLHLAPRLGTVDLSVHKGDVIFPSVNYLSATPFLPLSPVTFNLEARKAGTKDILLPMHQCSFNESTAYFLCLIDDGQKFEKAAIKLK
ncbi:DUF4397 domain-containing protein [Bacillus sp. B-jedd]|uniref:DUF4397 domain-containing protein n=1 Tax=Bacillus sp. B-jedd TaxID=1476857 RepID=UPI0005155F3E|nr:DUF4397 domain-containing protein [Bacillus sp. B-jedd]CEG27540.1 LPXTG-motif cell wall anchor domain-containing protein [Bacillus sp. B-jedd]